MIKSRTLVKFHYLLVRDMNATPEEKNVFLIGGIRSQWVMSVAIGFQVVFFNWFFNSIAVELTNFENHRYEKSYNESLIGSVD